MTTRNPEAFQTIQLPARVVDRIERRLPRTEFEDAGQYVAYVVEEVLAQVEETSGEEPTEADREELETRLKSLGYLED